MWDESRPHFLKTHSIKTAMKETGVIFSTPMALAAIEGIKKITRRMRGLEQLNVNPDSYSVAHYVGKLWWVKRNLQPQELLVCPFGEVGDRIWMRETWAKQLNGNFTFKAGKEEGEKPDYTATGRWKPSIHMPRVACRFVAELVEIRLERLQAITEEDAIAEGIHCYGTPTPGASMFKNYMVPACEDIGVMIAEFSFQTLWESIHGEDSWYVNPWVWVLKFKRV